MKQLTITAFFTFMVLVNFAQPSGPIQITGGGSLGNCNDCLQQSEGRDYSLGTSSNTVDLNNYPMGGGGQYVIPPDAGI